MKSSASLVSRKHNNDIGEVYFEKEAQASVVQKMRKSI